MIILINALPLVSSVCFEGRHPLSNSCLHAMETGPDVVDGQSALANIHKRHRQEQRDLQSRITQKKKSATKKTRKGVNDECAELERALKERHESEIRQHTGVGDTHNGALGSCGTSSAEEENSSSISGANDRKKVEVFLAKEIERLSVSVPTELPTLSKKPNRQKARLARRAAEQENAIAQAVEEANNIPDLHKKEKDAMQKEFDSRNLIEKEVRSDGHCLYAAVADQLSEAGIGLKSGFSTSLSEPERASIPDYLVVRQVAASYISDHPNNFLPFLEKPLDDYTRKIRETGEWGGHLELSALSKAYHVNINILQGNNRVEVIASDPVHNAHTLWLAYYRHSFGLGEHYNSLRRKP